MTRALVLLYGGAAYLAFLGVFVALLDFSWGTGYLRGIDQPPAGPRGTALAIDLGLLALFGVSHSVMARAGFKRVWTRIVPPVLERSTYVLVAAAMLGLLVWQWRALPDPLWIVPDGPARLAVWAVAGAAVLIVVWSTFLTDHFDLFGLRQVWLHFRGHPYTPVPYTERSLYRIVRHPMMVGFLVWLWAIPAMTQGHLVFSAGLSAYVFIGVAFEERALAATLGADYAAYRRRVRAFLPIPRLARVPGEQR